MDDSLSRPQIRRLVAIAGAGLLMAMGTLAVVQGAGASPRYAIALILLGAASMIRAGVSASEHPRLAHAAPYLTGAAFGLAAAGFVG